MSPGCDGPLQLLLRYQSEGNNARLSINEVVFGTGAAELSFILSGCRTSGCTLRSVGGEHPQEFDELVFAVNAPCPSCPRELWIPSVAAVWPDGASSEIETPLSMPPDLCDNELTASVTLEKDVQ